MKKKLLSFLVVCGALLSACNINSKKSYTYDYTYFNGICALSGDFNNGVDYGLTNEWTKGKVKALNAKSARVWIALSGLFNVEENDEIVLNQSYYKIMIDHIDKFKEGGVENFVCLYSSFLHPYGYVPSTGYVVPDPREEYEQYTRFLDLQAKASAKIKELFPDINNFEPANEPDFACPGCIHKNGFIFGGGMSVNYSFIYNDDDKVSILLDLCWYVREAVRKVDPNAKVVFPGLTNQASVPDFVDLIYQKVESKTLPTKQEKSDIDPDNYFDILNWHPYPTKFDNENNVDWDAWVEFNQSVHNVMVKHKDDGKPVYFTELGWTDFGSRDEVVLNRIGNNYTTAFRLIKEKMPWVASVFAFRLTNLVYQIIDDTGGEENFGLFYHPNDPLTPAKPKPAAYAVAKAFNGDDYDLDAHL